MAHAEICPVCKGAGKLPPFMMPATVAAVGVGCRSWMKTKSSIFPLDLSR